MLRNIVVFCFMMMMVCHQRPIHAMEMTSNNSITRMICIQNIDNPSEKTLLSEKFAQNFGLLNSILEDSISDDNPLICIPTYNIDVQDFFALAHTFSRQGACTNLPKTVTTELLIRYAHLANYLGADTPQFGFLDWISVQLSKRLKQKIEEAGDHKQGWNNLLNLLDKLPHEVQKYKVIPQILARCDTSTTLISESASTIAQFPSYLHSISRFKDDKVIVNLYNNSTQICDLKGKNRSYIADAMRFIDQTQIELADGTVGSMIECDIHLYRTNGTVKNLLIGHTGSISSLIQLKDGRLVSGSADHTMRLWNLNGITEVTFTGHAGTVLSLIQLKDTRIASGSDDNSIKIWNLDGTLAKTFCGHTNSVLSLVQLNNGNIVSGAWDYSIKIWNLNGEVEKTLTGHTDVVSALAELNDGKLASGSWDKTLKIWDLNLSTHIQNSPPEQQLLMAVLMEHYTKKRILPNLTLTKFEHLKKIYTGLNSELKKTCGILDLRYAKLNESQARKI